MKGRSVLVIGGTSGIGMATAEALLLAGASVLAAGHAPAGAEAADAVLRAIDPARGAACLADVRDPAAMQDLVAQAERRYGGLDGLVYSAGVQTYGTVEAMPPEEWDAGLAVNLSGAFHACRSAIPSLRRRGGGAIVLVGSALAHAAVPGVAGYVACKAGLLGLARAMAVDHAPDRIRVNAVCPGAVDTPMWRGTAMRQPGGPPIEHRIAAAGRNYPLGRIGTPADAAAAILFLLGPGADFVTGAEVVVDGGRLAAYARTA